MLLCGRRCEKLWNVGFNSAKKGRERQERSALSLLSPLGDLTTTTTTSTSTSTSSLLSRSRARSSSSSSCSSSFQSTENSSPSTDLRRRRRRPSSRSFRSEQQQTEPSPLCPPRPPPLLPQTLSPRSSRPFGSSCAPTPSAGPSWAPLR